MHFKITQEQVASLVTFVRENLLTKHGEPILHLLQSLPKIEDVIKSAEPPEDQLA